MIRYSSGWELRTLVAQPAGADAKHALGLDRPATDAYPEYLVASREDAEAIVQVPLRRARSTRGRWMDKT